MAIDSAIVQIGLTVLNAIVHYILYRAAVTLIVLAKDKFVEIFGYIGVTQNENTKKMADPEETYVTMNHSQFTWPYPIKMIAKPTQPPLKTGICFYEKRLDPDDCKCETHGFQSDMSRYKRLADKERRLHNEVSKVNREMTNFVSSILENCDVDEEAMRSVYQIDYDKRGLPLAKYRSLMAAVDSPIGSPIYPVVTDLRDGYRDPTRFRYSAIERPTIQPTKAIDFTKIPETFSRWEEPFTGQSEYVSTISNVGLINMKSRQQYLEPHPSSRRRRGDS